MSNRVVRILTMSISSIQKELRKSADTSIAANNNRFFKTGKGEYGEGDIFLGVRVPTIRSVAKKHKDAPVAEILGILKSEYHEERLLALIMLVNLFSKSDDVNKKTIYKAYLANTEFINGWDLVDSSAHQIVGGYLLNNSRGKLLSLAKSKSLWERRIAIISTYHFIKRDEYKDTLKLSKLLINDDEDLIHKAVGWMLREVGNRDRSIEEHFLLEHYQIMPRTMLRYAIEKFDPAVRKQYLKGEL